MKTANTGMLLSVALIAGCASNPMQVSDSQTVAEPSPDEAQVVFLRSSFVGSAISASLYDVTDGDTKFIGIINNGTKVIHETEPGDHVFMVVSEAADFMEAELGPGKTYYSIVTPRMGAWKARFSLWPIRNDGTGEYNTASGDFNRWMNGTTLVVNSPESLQWFENNKTSVMTKQREYWEVWQQKSGEDIAKRTLRPEDGLPE